jgi:hypothetical protein
MQLGQLAVSQLGPASCRMGIRRALVVDSFDLASPQIRSASPEAPLR